MNRTIVWLGYGYDYNHWLVKETKYSLCRILFLKINFYSQINPWCLSVTKTSLTTLYIVTHLYTDQANLLLISITTGTWKGTFNWESYILLLDCRKIFETKGFRLVFHISHSNIFQTWCFQQKNDIATDCAMSHISVLVCIWFKALKRKLICGLLWHCSFLHQ